MIEHQLVDVAVQQTRALLSTLETMAAVLQQTAVKCPHPSDRIVTVGTMGHSTRICQVCQEELSLNEEAAL